MFCSVKNAERKFKTVRLFALGVVHIQMRHRLRGLLPHLIIIQIK